MEIRLLPLPVYDHLEDLLPQMSYATMGNAAEVAGQGIEQFAGRIVVFGFSVQYESFPQKPQFQRLYWMYVDESIARHDPFSDGGKTYQYKEGWNGKDEPIAEGDARIKKFFMQYALPALHEQALKENQAFDERRKKKVVGAPKKSLVPAKDHHY